MGSFKMNYKQYDTSRGFGNAREWRKSFNERMSGAEAIEIIGTEPETPYSILGIARNASSDEIRAAFRKQMKIWHPDLNPDRVDEATEMCKKLNAAYSLIS